MGEWGMGNDGCHEDCRMHHERTRVEVIPAGQSYGTGLACLGQGKSSSLMFDI
jgi:hypothetical protein